MTPEQQSSSRDHCPRCGHLILYPDYGCQVCPVLEAEKSNMSPEQAADSLIVSGPGASSPHETFYLQELVQRDPCARCGFNLSSEGECLECKVIGEEAAANGWGVEKVAEIQASVRQENLRRLADERAEVAGKSDQQITAEREDRKARDQAFRASIEPQIPTPACITDYARKLEDYTTEEDREVSDWAERRRTALPLGVSEFSAAGMSLLPCSFVSQGEAEAGYALLPFTRFLMLTDGPSPNSMVLDTIPFLTISRLTVTGPEEVERVVTKSRAAAFGLFSLAAKKEKKHSYLYIERHSQPAFLFRFDGMLPVELQATYAPFLNWYGQYQEQLIALYRLWHPA